MEIIIFTLVLLPTVSILGDHATVRARRCLVTLLGGVFGLAGTFFDIVVTGGSIADAGLRSVHVRRRLISRRDRLYIHLAFSGFDATRRSRLILLLLLILVGHVLCRLL